MQNILHQCCCLTSFRFLLPSVFVYLAPTPWMGPGVKLPIAHCCSLSLPAPWAKWKQHLDVLQHLLPRFTMLYFFHRVNAKLWGRKLLHCTLGDSLKTTTTLLACTNARSKTGRSFTAIQEDSPDRNWKPQHAISHQMLFFFRHHVKSRVRKEAFFEMSEMSRHHG